MPTYSVKAPNGKTYTVEGPAGASHADVVAAVLQQYPSAATKPAAPSTKRTWGEAASDVGAGLTTGVGSLVGLPGDVYGLVTGDMDNAVSRAGDRLKDAGRAAESEGLKARRANKQEKVQAAEAEGGAWAAFKTAFTETIGDPALAASLLVEQIPNLALMIGTGGAAAAVAAGRASAAALARGATKEVATRVANRLRCAWGLPPLQALAQPCKVPMWVPTHTTRWYSGYRRKGRPKSRPHRKRSTLRAPQARLLQPSRTWSTGTCPEVWRLSAP